MRFLNFTPQEIRALLFLLAALLMGSGITIYKRHHRGFAPELVLKESPSSSYESQTQISEASTEASVPTSGNSGVSRIPDPQNASPNSSRGQDSLEGKIDLNSASATELELLPQIGPVLSRRIINYRKTQGAFQRIEDVVKVPGIGPKTFEKIKDFITVE